MTDAVTQPPIILATPAPSLLGEGQGVGLAFAKSLRSGSSRSSPGISRRGSVHGPVASFAPQPANRETEDKENGKDSPQPFEGNGAQSNSFPFGPDPDDLIARLEAVQRAATAPAVLHRTMLAPSWPTNIDGRRRSADFSDPRQRVELLNNGYLTDPMGVAAETTGFPSPTQTLLNPSASSRLQRRVSASAAGTTGIVTRAMAGGGVGLHIVSPAASVGPTSLFGPRDDGAGTGVVVITRAPSPLKDFSLPVSQGNGRTANDKLPQSRLSLPREGLATILDEEASESQRIVVDKDEEEGERRPLLEGRETKEGASVPKRNSIWNCGLFCCWSRH